MPNYLGTQASTRQAAQRLHLKYKLQWGGRDGSTGTSMEPDGGREGSRGWVLTWILQWLASNSKGLHWKVPFALSPEAAIVVPSLPPVSSPALQHLVGLTTACITNKSQFMCHRDEGGITSLNNGKTSCPQKTTTHPPKYSIAATAYHKSPQIHSTCHCRNVWLHKWLQDVSS